MDRICPRRPGVEWQESVWSHFQPGKANDQRRQSLGASQSCWPKEHSAKQPQASIAKLSGEFILRLEMQRLSSNSGSARTSPALERLEPCEGKLSRAVLR